MKALLTYRVGPHGRKEERAMNYFVLLDASLSELCLLSCLNWRNDLEFFNFARVRTDRERKFRDGHVPQQLDENLTMVRTPSREFRNQSSDPGGPDVPADKKGKRSKNRAPSKLEKRHLTHLTVVTLSG